jgi:hypothetical protein
MSDVNYIHEYAPRAKDGKCKVMIGGRRRGYSSCHLGKDAPAHTRFRQVETERTSERNRRRADQTVESMTEALWDERCPRMTMSDHDREHYRVAAILVLSFLGVIAGDYEDPAIIGQFADSGFEVPIC